MNQWPMTTDGQSLIVVPSSSLEGSVRVLIKRWDSGQSEVEGQFRVTRENAFHLVALLLSVTAPKLADAITDLLGRNLQNEKETS